MKILPLFIPQQGCPFTCIYCNQVSITNSPNIDIDHFKVLISNFCHKNKDTNKEIAYFGGTFTALEKNIQLDYFNLIKPYNSKIRGVRLSTRPDCIDHNILTFLRENHVSTIELGIQSFSDRVLRSSGRGYLAEVAMNACKMIIDHGFDLIIQLMPGLPDDDRITFEETIKKTISLKPAGVRIYPTIVLKGTALEKIYHAGNYQPLELKETIQWLKDASKLLDKAHINILKLGLHSDLAPKDIIAGPFHPAIGELVKIEILFDDITLNWIPEKTLQVSASAISLFRGHDQLLLNKLKEHLLLDKIPIVINKEKKSPLYCFVNSEADKFW